jgi:hypothetical protein
MQAHRVQARRGLDWIVEGYRLFRRSPAIVLLLIFAYLSLLSLAAALPLAASCVVAVLLPAFSVVPLAAFRQLDRGEPVTFPGLFAGFRNNLPALLRLGLLYLLWTGVSLGLSALADDGQYLKIALLGDPAPDASAGVAAVGSQPAAQKGADDAVQVNGAQLLFLAAVSPVLIGLWFAPMLAAWHRLSALQSLFFAVVACLRNYRAFLVYFASLLVVGCAVAIVMAILAAILSTVLPEARDVLGRLILTVLFLMATSANYLSYRDIFFDGVPDTAAPASAPPAVPPSTPHDDAPDIH